MFENPFPDSSLIDQIGSSAHRDKARQAVGESLVLLKHNKRTLPIKKRAKKIVVVGEHANNTGLQSGGWTVSWQGKPENYDGATTILAGIEEMASGSVVYDEDASGAHTDADVAIIVVGETPYAEFFGDINDENENYSLTLSAEHQRYIDTYAGKGPKVIVVLVSGRPLVTTQQIQQADAFIAAWLPGSEGKGIAEVLFGKYNFTGKLPHSWPASTEDFRGRFGPNYWDTSTVPLFELGYRLKY